LKRARTRNVPKTPQNPRTPVFCTEIGRSCGFCPETAAVLAISASLIYSNRKAKKNKACAAVQKEMQRYSKGNYRFP